MVKKAPCYCAQFDDFMSKAEHLLQDKQNAPKFPLRFSTKVRGAEDSLEFKLTNNRVVYKYKIAGASKNEMALEQLRTFSEVFISLTSCQNTRTNANAVQEEFKDEEQINTGPKKQKKRSLKYSVLVEEDETNETSDIRQTDTS